MDCVDVLWLFFFQVLEMEKKQGSADQSSQLQTVQQEVKLLHSQTELLQQENAVKQQVWTLFLILQFLPI